MDVFGDVNDMAVLVAALVAVAVGSIWYSPFLFGKHWMRASGLHDADLGMTTRALLQAILGGVVANCVLLYLVACFMHIALRANVSVWLLNIWLIIFLAATMSSTVIWEKKPVAYVLIHLGYALVVVFGGTLIISHWPW